MAGDSSTSDAFGSGNSVDGLFTTTDEPGSDLPVTQPSDPSDTSFQTGAGTDAQMGSDDSSTSAPVVPEPGSFLMLALGGGIAYLRRRMNGKKANSDDSAQG